MWVRIGDGCCAAAAAAAEPQRLAATRLRSDRLFSSLCASNHLLPPRCFELVALSVFFDHGTENQSRFVLLMRALALLIKSRDTLVQFITY